MLKFLKYVWNYKKNSAEYTNLRTIYNLRQEELKNLEAAARASDIISKEALKREKDRSEYDRVLIELLPLLPLHDDPFTVAKTQELLDFYIKQVKG